MTTPVRQTILLIDDDRHPKGDTMESTLIVDDEEPIRSLAACYVEQMGFDVTTVAGAEEALRLCDEIGFDIVLTERGVFRPRPGMYSRSTSIWRNRFATKPCAMHCTAWPPSSNA